MSAGTEVLASPPLKTIRLAQAPSRLLQRTAPCQSVPHEQARTEETHLSVILPAITDDVNDFSELFALVRKRYAQARKLDPRDSGFEEPIFEISTRAEVWIVRLFIPVALGAIVTVFFTRGIPFIAIGSAAVL